MRVFVNAPTAKIRQVVIDRLRANLDVVIIARDYSKVTDLVNDGTSVLSLGPWGSTQAFLLKPFGSRAGSVSANASAVARN